MGWLPCNYPIRSQYSYQANCNTPICYKTGLTVWGKTGNIAFHLVLLQYCETSCTFCCLFYHSFNRSLSLVYICCSLRTHHERTPGWKLLENISILPIFSLRKENMHSKYRNFYLQDGVTGFWPNLALTYWNADR